ncbi:hypothetical protein HG530_004344 [Fusarium avenaceum]|nr:hypothetical protein HG530_004344 [Fusarium avenaceum]
MSKAGIKVWASQKEKTNLGPVMSSYKATCSLEESTSTLVLRHVGQDSETTLRVFEVAVLDTGLDNIKRSRNDQRSRSTSNGSNKVLEPAGLVVVLKVEEVLLGESRTTEELSWVSILVHPIRSDFKTYSKRTRSVTGSSPAPTTVQTETLIGNDLEDTTATEGLGVCLTLDLEDIEGQKNDLTNTDQTASALAFEAPRGELMLMPYLPAVECMMALPVFLPKAPSKSAP